MPIWKEKIEAYQDVCLTIVLEKLYNLQKKYIY